VRQKDREPIEAVVLFGPGRTRFEIACPSLPLELEADFDRDLLHAGLRVVRD
jgi:hypothetical protein